MPPPAPAAPPAPQPPKRNHTNTIIISTAAVLIAGIVTAGIVVSNSRDADDPTPTVVKAASTPSASSTKTSLSPSPSQETFKFGDTADIGVGDRKFSAVVLAFKDSGIAGIPELLPEDQEWATAEVKVCNKGTAAFPVSPFTWSLAYEDGARVEATHMSGGEFPQPLYPMDTKVKGGDCVRGHVLFEVPKGGRAERVVYSPADLDEPVEWQVGK